MVFLLVSMQAYRISFTTLLFIVFFSIPFLVFGQTPTGITTDLVVHTNTWTPEFYQGRSLPVNGSDIIVTALVFTNGVQSNVDYNYVWKINDKRIETAPNDNVFSFSNRLDTAVNLTVSVFTQNQQRIAVKTLTIPMVQPEIYFYAINPLRGMSHQAIQDTFTLIAEEATFQAAPYYFDFQNGELKHTWNINNKKTTVESPLQLTIQKTQKEKSDSTINFSSYNSLRPLQYAEGTFKVQF